MRTSSSLMLALALSSSLFGCARDNPVLPLASSERAGITTAPLFLVRPADSRLPGPGLEASTISSADRAAYERASRGAAGGANGNPVVVWNRLTTELGTQAPALPPPALSRDYALVQVGIFETVSVAGDRARGNLPQHALAAGVASVVLPYLFPSRADRIEQVTSQEVAADQGSPGAFGAWALGRAVGRLVVARGRSDGFTATYAGTPPTGTGYWTGTNPVLPMAGEWKTWVIPSGHDPEPEPPYTYGSAADLADVQEVLDVSLHRTQEMVDVVHKWADRSPPAIWNEMLNERMLSADLDVAASARASAFLNIAMADAFIECWACKYAFWTARPFQRIPGLVTAIPTPNFPTYTSGHSTISAAAAQVLGEVFPAERDYFVQQAQEAAISRLWGGIHFRHDNEAGARLGTVIGGMVVERMRANDARALLANR